MAFIMMSHASPFAFDNTPVVEILMLLQLLLSCRHCNALSRLVCTFNRMWWQEHDSVARQIEDVENCINDVFAAHSAPTHCCLLASIHIDCLSSYTHNVVDLLLILHLMNTSRRWGNTRDLLKFGGIILIVLFILSQDWLRLCLF
jgi:hypothetical protein